MFFDLGGTLFSNKGIPKVSSPVLVEAAQRLGVEHGIARVGPAYVRASQLANAEYKDRPYYLHREFFYATYEAFVDELETKADEGFFDWLYEAQRQVMITKIRLRRDCLDTLRALRARGLSLSIVSNIDDDYLHPMMESLELAPHFDHWSSSEEARSCKPHSGIFELALRKSGHRPEEVVFVGDSRLHDVRGARAMGMKPVLIEEAYGRSPLDVGDAEPDHVIEKLGELVPLLDTERA